LISTSSFAGVGTGNSTCYKIWLHLHFSIHTQKLSMGCYSLPQFTDIYCRTLRAETLPPKAEYCTACIVLAISLFLVQQDYFFFFFFFFFSFLFSELGGIWRWPLEPHHRHVRKLGLFRKLAFLFLPYLFTCDV
jgi:hypothetical protein